MKLGVLKVGLFHKPDRRGGFSRRERGGSERLPLSSYPIQVTFTVKDQSTLQGVSGVALNSYRVVEFFGIPISRELVDSDVTGAGGSVKMTCISEVIMEVDAVGSGYAAKTQRFDAWFGDNQQGVIYMVSDGSANLCKCKNLYRNLGDV